LPRAPDGTAIIADPRNDENLIIAGLHAAFLLFHNHATDEVLARRPAGSPEAVFDEARRLVTWHYHWLVLHEFLPLIVGQPLVDELLDRGPRFYRPSFGEAFVPVEFQGAAYRFGHSMVAPAFRANLAGDGGSPFVALLFDPSQEGQADPGDLRGRVRAPRRFVGWQSFFDFGDGEVAPSKRIDTVISTPLFTLPLSVIPGGQPPAVLPQRNLLRHLTWSLPSGQAIARAMGVASLARRNLDELRELGFDRSTPLWYYVLKEAEVMEDGRRLGPVGARIVAEVFIGLLQSDPEAYLTRDPGWRPTLPTRTGAAGDFRMTDLLALAGVDPVSRGQ
jgi:heme peroxidase